MDVEGTVIVTLVSNQPGVTEVVLRVTGLWGSFSDGGLQDVADDLCTRYNQEVTNQGTWSVNTIHVVERRTV